jgi:hypothetical protein
VKKLLIIALLTTGCAGTKIVTVTKPVPVYVDMPKAAPEPMPVYTESMSEASKSEVIEVEASPRTGMKATVTAKVEVYSCPPCPACPACPPCPAAPACPAPTVCPPPPDNKQNPWMMMASAASGAISVIAAAYAKKLFNKD